MPPTVTLALAAGDVPPEPVQVTEYVALCDGVTVTEPALPEVVKLVPVHDVAFVDDHVSVADWPEVIDVGDAESEAVGVEGGGGGGVVPVAARLSSATQPLTPVVKLSFHQV